MIRAAAAALLGALAGAAWLAFFYAAGRGLHLDFGIDPPRLASGFHAAERDRDTGLTFAWTGAEAGLRLPGLDRRAPWTFTVRVRGGRADARGNPLLTFFVDGIQLHTHESTPEFQEARVLIPPRPERRGIAIVMRSSSTFVPGPDDPRQLGVMVDALTLSPDGLVLPPTEMFGAAMVGGAALGAAIALLGVTLGSAIGSAVLLSAGQGAVLAYGFGPYTNFAQIAVRLALFTAAAVTVLAVLARWRSAPLRNTARFALAFSAGACFLELLVLLHPNMPFGDALFQAHRFHEILRGNFYFTSVAPGGYAFPYAPGLYVVAWPFSGLVRRELGDVALLRIVTIVANGTAGLLLYWMTARVSHDRLAAAIAVAVYHLIPLSFRIITVGNLTNAFAESLTVAALAVICSPALASVTSVATAALAIVLTAAFLSHTSTFAILSVCAFATAALSAMKGAPDLRGAAKGIAVATTAAIAAAVTLYYAHFMETYQTELARLGSETAAAAPDAGGRSALQRALDVPRYLRIYFGLPVLLLAGLGAVDRWRRSGRDRLTLAIAAWALTCAAYLVVGVLTPLDMRYYLAIIPALALLAGAGASWWWTMGGGPRVFVAVLLAWIVWTGVWIWWGSLSV